MSSFHSKRNSGKEQRTGYDRRVSEDLCYFKNGGIERRSLVDRRLGIEPAKLLPTIPERSIVKLMNWLIQ